MKFKNIELKGVYRFQFFDDWFNIFDENGKQIYSEDSDGDWSKWEYDKNGKEVYHENSSGYINDERKKEGNQ